MALFLGRSSKKDIFGNFMNSFGYLFNLAGYQAIFSIPSDTGYQKELIIRPDIRCITSLFSE
jgi:hypothetical protein